MPPVLIGFYFQNLHIYTFPTSAFAHKHIGKLSHYFTPLLLVIYPLFAPCPGPTLHMYTAGIACQH